MHPTSRIISVLFCLALITVSSLMVLPVTGHSSKNNYILPQVEKMPLSGKQKLAVTNKIFPQSNQIQSKTFIYNFTEGSATFPQMNFNITNLSNQDSSFYIKSNNFTGGYYLTNNNSLACYNLGNHRYRWLANLPIINYKYLSYSGVYYILMPYYNSKGQLTEIISYGTNSTGYLESFFYNIPTGLSYEKSYNYYILKSSNFQLNYLGSNTSSIIFSNGTMLFFNSNNNVPLGSYKLSFFEANNIYYVPQWKSFINIQATNSNLDDIFIYTYKSDTLVLKEKLSYLTSGTLIVGGVPDIVIYGDKVFFQAQGADGIGYANVILLYSQSNGSFSVQSSLYSNGAIPIPNLNPPNDYIPIITKNGFLPLLPGGWGSSDYLFYNVFDNISINSSSPNQNATNFINNLVGYNGNIMGQGISSFSYNFTNCSLLCIPNILQHKIVFLKINGTTDLNSSVNVSIKSNIDDFSININGTTCLLSGITANGTFNANLQPEIYNISLKFYGRYAVSREINITKGGHIFFNISQYSLVFHSNLENYYLDINQTQYNSSNGNITLVLFGFDYHYSAFLGNQTFTGNVDLNKNLTISLSYKPRAKYVLSVDANIQSFNLVIGNLNCSTANGSMHLILANGSYNYTASEGSYETIFGSVVVNGNTSLSLNFLHVIANKNVTGSRYLVNITELGLPNETTWFVVINGIERDSNNSTITFAEFNGTYPVLIKNISGYDVSTVLNNISVNGTNVSKKIVFIPTQGTNNFMGMKITDLYWIIVIFFSSMAILTLVVSILKRR